MAAYARWCEARYRHPLIVKRVRSIARVHLLACLPPPDRDPLVVRTLASIERGRGRDARAALFPADAADAADGAPAGGPPATTVPAEPAPARRRMRSSPRLVARRPPRG